MGLKGMSSEAAGVDWPRSLLDLPVGRAAKPIAAADARISLDTLVIGIEIEGRYRAYPVAAMSRVRSHVWNDRIGDTPVAVAYCGRTECGFGFAARDQQTAPDLAVGGWLNEGEVQDMLVRHGSHRYEVTSGLPLDPTSPPLPFDTLDVEKTTWGEWVEAHPDTELVPSLQPADVTNH